MESTVFVIVPSYNEAAIISTTVSELLSHGFTIVVVDDGSTDNTENVLKGLPIFYIKHKINLGQGAALQTGIQFALQNNAMYIATFDADGQHKAFDICRMLLYMNKDIDMIFGSRFLPESSTNVSIIRKLILKLACIFNFILTGLFLSDAHNGIRLLNRNAAKRIKISKNGMSHATEILLEVKKHNLKFIELPVTVKYTSYSLKKGQRLFHSFKVVQDIVLHKILKK